MYNFARIEKKFATQLSKSDLGWRKIVSNNNEPGFRKKEYPQEVRLPRVKNQPRFVLRKPKLQQT